MQLTPLRAFVLTTLVGLTAIVGLLPNDPITTDEMQMRPGLSIQPDQGYRKLYRQVRRANHHTQTLANALIRERAEQYVMEAGVSARGPLVPDSATIRQAIQSGVSERDTAELRRIASLPTANQVADSIQQLRERFYAGSLGDVRTGLLLLPRSADTTKFYHRYARWIVLQPSVAPHECVVEYTPSELRSISGTGNPFGPCFWFGAFGVPGRAAGEWLDGGGIQGSGWISSPGRELDRGSRGRVSTPAERQSKFVDEIFAPGRFGAPVTKCVARGGAACPPELARPSLRFSWSGPMPPSIVLDVQTLLERGTFVSPADIYNDFGAEKFARLWRSPLPFAEAFQQITGEDVRDYVRRRVRDETGLTYHPGPWLPWPALAVVLLAITACLAVVVGASRRPAAV
jgi:hypothetical protein